MKLTINQLIADYWCDPMRMSFYMQEERTE